MRNFVVLLAVLAFGGPVFAADMATKMPLKAPPAPVSSWAGFYLGANVGGHWARDSITAAFDPVGWGAFAAAADAGAVAGSMKSSGIIGGIQAGYNWQANNIVWGVEADADGVGGTASRTVASSPFPGGFHLMSNSIKETFLATVRPRLGVVAGGALFYATGGLAIGSLKATDANVLGVLPADIATVTASGTRAGWTAGGGIEYSAWMNWTAKVEYLYVGLGTFSTSIPTCAACSPGSDITVNHRYTDNILRVGLNYHFR
jgi:outer membrane immunogenic protein